MIKTVLHNIKKEKYLIILILLNIFFYIFFVIPAINEKNHLPHDTYKDIAYAQSVLNGNSIFADPALKDEYIWYPPLNALIMAFISKITGISLFLLYHYSPLFINFFIPILYYLLISTCFGKTRAFLSTLLIPVMPWLGSHIFSMALISIHSIALVLLILLLFVRTYKKGLHIKGSIGLSVLIGLSLLHHSLSGCVLYGGILLFLFINTIVYKKRVFIFNLVILAFLPILIWSPFILPNLLQPKLNSLPLEHISLELSDPAMNLFIPHLFLFPVFLIFLITGIIYAVRKHKKNTYLLFLCLGCVTLPGIILGYLRILSEKIPSIFMIFHSFPVLIPHEFMWFFQLFIIIFIITGYSYINITLAKNRHRLLHILLIIGIILPAYTQLPQLSTRYFTHYPGTWNIKRDYLEWIKENTKKDAVILTSDVVMAYYDLQPATGRRIVAHLEVYMNYNVDAKKRIRDKELLIHNADMDLFRELAHEYMIDYVVINKDTITPERFQFFLNNFIEVYNQQNYVYIFKIR